MGSELVLLKGDAFHYLKYTLGVITYILSQDAGTNELQWLISQGQYEGIPGLLW